MSDKIPVNFKKCICIGIRNFLLTAETGMNTEITGKKLLFPVCESESISKFWKKQRSKTYTEKLQDYSQ